MIDNAFTFTLPTRTAILVAAFDSQLKWARTIRSALESRGFACRTIIPSDIRHAISDSQLADSGGGAVDHMPWVDLVTASLNADVVVLAIQGPQVRRFCHDVFDAVELTGVAPPVTITGWVGVIIEKIVAGYLERLSDRAARVRALARWVLPHGLHLQLRQARARRNSRRMQTSRQAQIVLSGFDSSERHPSKVG